MHWHPLCPRLARLSCMCFVCRESAGRSTDMRVKPVHTAGMWKARPIPLGPPLFVTCDGLRNLSVSGSRRHCRRMGKHARETILASLSKAPSLRTCSMLCSGFTSCLNFKMKRGPPMPGLSAGVWLASMRISIHGAIAPDYRAGSCHVPAGVPCSPPESRLGT
jgi:hypothetical protein